MIFADVFGQTQVVQLARPREEEAGYHGYRSRKGVVTTETHVMRRREEKQLEKCVFFRGLEDLLGLTSGSPESTLVWIRIFPMRTSLHTALRAGSIVSPARRTDTPVICGDEVTRETRRMGRGNPPENTTVTHPFSIVTAAFVLVTLRRLNDARLPEKKVKKIRQQNTRQPHL